MPIKRKVRLSKEWDGIRRSVLAEREEKGRTERIKVLNLEKVRGGRVLRTCHRNGTIEKRHRAE